MSNAERRTLVVAIDGPAGAGKSTVSMRLTEELGYRLLDTGALYRAVALLAKRQGVGWDDEEALAKIAGDLDVEFRIVDGNNHIFVAKEDLSALIREPDISTGASKVSSLPELRKALLDLQRTLGSQGGVVAEGRDVGTVVFPKAEVKFFLTASDTIRAKRRFDELTSKGMKVDLQQTLEEMRERDERDSNRKFAPLAQANDAILIDSSGQSLEEVVAKMSILVREREDLAKV